MKKLLSTILVAATLTVAAPVKEAQAQSEPFLGQMTYFAGNFAPRGWALCDGQLLPISQYSALFSLLGTTYGGDGRTTFALPDMRGRTLIHAGRGPGLTPRNLGAKVGSETNTMTVNQMPSHNHTGAMKASTGAASGGTPTVLGTGGTTYIGRSGAIDVTMTGGTVEVGHNGGGQPINNMQPSLAVNCIIALQGIFPSRS